MRRHWTECSPIWDRQRPVPNINFIINEFEQGYSLEAILNVPRCEPSPHPIRRSRYGKFELVGEAIYDMIQIGETNIPAA